MNVNRRQFLFRAAPAALGAAIAVEELLKPRATIFLPPRGGWGGRSLGQLWLDYANDVRPLGVAVSIVEDSTRYADSEYVILETMPGAIELHIGQQLTRATARRMRAALTSERVHDGICASAVTDLTPWHPRNSLLAFFDVRKVYRPFA